MQIGSHVVASQARARIWKTLEWKCAGATDDNLGSAVMCRFGSMQILDTCFVEARLLS